MNRSVFWAAGETFVEYECIQGLSYKMARTREYFAFFPVFTGTYNRTRGKSAHFGPSCLSPLSLC